MSGSTKPTTSSIRRSPGTPNDARLACLAGDLRYREGRVFDADKTYKAAIRIDPKNARAIYGIARVFRTTSLRKKAYEMLRVAHAIDSSDPEIARAFYMANPYSKAALDYAKAQLAANRDTRDSKGNPAIERRLKRVVAELEALDGRTGCEVADPDKPHQVALGRLMNGRRVTGVSIPLKINGSSTTLRLDTGAGGILLSSKFAERMGIKRLADTEIGGIARCARQGLDRNGSEPANRRHAVSATAWWRCPRRGRRTIPAG